MATVLNDLLIQDPMQQTFAFSHLILLPQENSLHFISCGCGHLWLTPKGSSSPKLVQSDHPPLGKDRNIQFSEVNYPWQIGDSLVFYDCSNSQSIQADSFFPKEQFETSLSENINLTPQKQVNAILRKAKITLSRTSDERSIFLLSILRLA
jgi:hypothetical protein